jgi:hypothetical protein
LKEQDSNPHLKDSQIFKISKLRSKVLLKRKIAQRWVKHVVESLTKLIENIKILLFLKKNEHVSMLNMIDPRNSFATKKIENKIK